MGKNINLDGFSSTSGGHADQCLEEEIESIGSNFASSPVNQ